LHQSSVIISPFGLIARQPEQWLLQALLFSRLYGFLILQTAQSSRVVALLSIPHDPLAESIAHFLIPLEP
jgi:hypothetical protein